MNINDFELQKNQLSYDKIIKSSLKQSKEVTIRFINGLFGDDIPLDSPVEWLDKETINDKYTAVVADFYSKIAGKMYSIEVEQDGRSDDIAVRVFKYAVGGAILHGMTATKAELSITFPQPAVIFLNSTKKTPNKLIWNIDFFDGQKVTLQVPTIKLADLSIKEIAERNLFPIGQFYLRTIDKLKENELSSFFKVTTSLVEELRKAIECGLIPNSIGLQMQDVIRKTMENVIKKSELEVDISMITNTVETIPWIDYREIFAKIEESATTKGKAEGIAEGEIKGKAEGIVEAQMKIARKAFTRVGRNRSISEVVNILKDLDIPDDIIESAKKQILPERDQHIKKRNDYER